MESAAKLIQPEEQGEENAEHQERCRRIEILRDALHQLEEGEQWLIAKIKRTPVEMDIGDIYRAVPCSLAEYNELKEKIREEIELLLSGKGNLMSRINLLSGKCS